MASSTTNLDLISSSQASKEITANALFDAESPAALFGRRASTTANLTWGYYGGAMSVNGIVTAIPNGTKTLTNDATNYLEADPTTGNVAVNTSNFTAANIPLYSVVTAGNVVTSYTDYRVASGPSYVPAVTLAATINAAADKNTPIGADKIAIIDSTNNSLKTTTFTEAAALFGASDTITANVTANGSTQATATALTTIFNKITTANTGTGVRLQSGLTAPKSVYIDNDTANAVNVYPFAGAAIDSLAANAPYVIPAGSGGMFTYTAANQFDTFLAGSHGANQVFTVAPGTDANHAARIDQISLMPTVASNTSVDIFGAAGASINMTGNTTVTGIVSCTTAQVGSSKRIVPAIGFSVTASANLIVDGATSGTFSMPAGAIIDVFANTTTQFVVTTIEATGTWTPNQGSGLTVVGAFSSSGVWRKSNGMTYVSGQLNGATSIAASTNGVLCSNVPFSGNPNNVVHAIGSALNSGSASAAIAYVYGTSAYTTGALSATPVIYFSCWYPSL